MKKYLLPALLVSLSTMAAASAAQAASFTCSAKISLSGNGGSLFFSPSISAPDVGAAEAQFIAVIASLPGRFRYNSLKCTEN